MPKYKVKLIENIDRLGQQLKQKCYRVNDIKRIDDKAILSPVLANIYLHYALDLWFEKKVKLKMRGRAMMIRYAGDFVCAFQFANDAERFYKVLAKRLKLSFSR